MSVIRPAAPTQPLQYPDTVTIPRVTSRRGPTLMAWLAALSLAAVLGAITGVVIGHPTADAATYMTVRTPSTTAAVTRTAAPVRKAVMATQAPVRTTAPARRLAVAVVPTDTVSVTPTDTTTATPTDTPTVTTTIVPIIHGCLPGLVPDPHWGCITPTPTFTP